jgi:hypothetical protein
MQEGFPGVEFATTNTLDDEFLSNIDVLLLTSASSGTTAVAPLSTAEQGALLGFVNRGGGVLVFAENAGWEPTNESFLDSFGLDSAGQTGDPPFGGASVAMRHPITDGPFGWISTFMTWDGGWFDSVGPATPLASLDLNGQIALAVLNRGQLVNGSGAVVFFSDTSMIWDGYLTEANKNLILNSIAFVAPEPCTLALLVMGSASMRRSRRAR